VTLDEIGRWVKAGEDVKILENDTGEDLTAVTFAQIILEEERRKSGLLSLRVLREIIQHGEAALQGLSATVDRGMEAIRSVPERAGRRVQELTQVAERLGQLQHVVDETVRRSVERVAALPAFQKEMRRIERSIRALEARIARLRPGSDGPPRPTRPRAAAAPSSLWRGLKQEPRGSARARAAVAAPLRRHARSADTVCGAGAAKRRWRPRARAAKSELLIAPETPGRGCSAARTRWCCRAPSR